MINNGLIRRVIASAAAGVLLLSISATPASAQTLSADSMSASAGQTARPAVPLVHQEFFAGYYYSNESCQQAGAIGVLAHGWDGYYCAPGSDDDGNTRWALYGFIS